MKKFAVMVAGFGALFSLPSFAENNVVLGTGLGAALGAVIGHQIEHDNGAWVGGAVGAVTGAAIASSSNGTRYVEREYYANDYNGYNNYNSYNVYSNTPRRDIYVVEPGYYDRHQPQVIYVEDRRGRGHGHRHDHHRGHGYERGYQQPGTVVIVR